MRHTHSTLRPGCRELQLLGPWDRHRLLLRQRAARGAAAAGSAAHAPPKSDAAALRESHQFIRQDGGVVGVQSTAGERLAARYYNKLLKEYALCDLSRYRECKVGLRWRTEHEVVIGKGQFVCASLTCESKHWLKSFEVPFSYEERGEQKQVRQAKIQAQPVATWAACSLVEHCSSFVTTVCITVCILGCLAGVVTCSNGHPPHVCARGCRRW
jgi:protein FRA10AC1